MSITFPVSFAEEPPVKRLDVLFEELSELAGQRNAIDGRIVEIVAEIDRDGLWGNTGARSVAALMAWKLGTTRGNAQTITTVAQRQQEFPRCVAGLREGRLSLDQVGVIAARAGEGSDAHYEQLARHASVSQLRTAIKLEPRPEPAPRPPWAPAITKTSSQDCTTWRITLTHPEAATFEAALGAHREALITAWKHDRPQGASESAPPLPDTLDAFLRLVETSWDGQATRRPHAAHTSVVVHLDLEQRAAALHLGPLLTEAERQYLTCDATYEVWFQREGVPIGAGRSTRTINRRLRRALEHRHPCCAVPGCGATRGLHAHHIRHWEHGGPTELPNLILLLCPFHHREHHRGQITITGDAEHLTITDRDGTILHPGSLARPPTNTPPQIPPYPGPSGERAQWWWYDPYQPQPPPTTN